MVENVILGVIIAIAYITLVVKAGSSKHNR